jgi:hypothetical protein
MERCDFIREPIDPIGAQSCVSGRDETAPDFDDDSSSPT